MCTLQTTEYINIPMSLNENGSFKQSNMSVKAVVLVNSLPPISVVSPGLPCTSTTLSSLNEMNLIFVHVIIRFL